MKVTKVKCNAGKCFTVIVDYFIWGCVLLLWASSAGADINITTDIGEDTIWEDTTQPYVIQQSVTINNATLTIKPGVEVRLADNVRLLVGWNAESNLIAVGTEENPVVFTLGFSYIEFSTHTGPDTILDHVIIEESSHPDVAVVTYSSNSTIQNSIIRNNSGNGISVLSEAKPYLSANTYVNNGRYPIEFQYLNSMHSLDDQSVFEGNAFNMIRCMGSSLSEDVIVPDPGVPLFFENSFSVNNATLTIKPGVEIRLADNVCLLVGYNAESNLIAVGTEENPVVFTLALGWSYIEFSTHTGPDTILDHVIIEESSHPDVAVVTYSSNSTIQNSIIRNNSGNGISVLSEAKPYLSANTYVNNGRYPIEFQYLNSMHSLDDQSVFEGNAFNMIRCMGSGVSEDLAVVNPGVPLFFENSFNIHNVTLTFSSGITAYMGAGVLMRVGGNAPSNLIVNGTAEDPVLFTANPYSDDLEWVGITFTDHTGNESLVSHAIIERAQTGIDIYGSSPPVRNTTIRNCAHYGIHINGLKDAYITSPEITCNTLTGNPVGIVANNNPTPDIVNNTFYNNVEFGLQNNTTTGHVIMAEDNYWGATYGPGTSGADNVSDYVDYDPFLTNQPACTVAVKADFTADPADGCEQLLVNFTDTSLGVVDVWSWDFNDDGVEDSNNQHPTNVFAVPGVFPVTLTVSSAYGTFTASHDITVYESVPSADFAADLTNGMAPLNVQFTDLSISCGTDSIVEWSWDLDGDGSEDSNEQHPIFVYTNTGSYNVSLTVTDEDGDEDSITYPDFIIVTQECTLFYKDEDGDGFGTDDNQCLYEPAVPYTATENGDCDDSDAEVNPDAREIRDGIDNNCDGIIDKKLQSGRWK